MWEWLTGFLKSLFGGKGTTQIGAKNKSVTTGDNSGTIGHMIVADIVHLGASPPPAPPKVPVVEVGLALANHPLRGIIHFLCITIKNATDKAIFIGNFLLEMEDGQTIYVKADSITGEPQHKRQLLAGDKATYHIDAITLKEVGSSASQYAFAVVEDVVGPRYKSESKTNLQKCLGELLAEKQ